MTREDPAPNVPNELELDHGGLLAEPARIGNPFARFRTRAFWLGAIIRRSRAAESERTKPDWFNR